MHFKVGFSSYAVIWLFFIIMLESCSMSYYTPNAQNVPLNDEKLEGGANLSFQKGLYSRGLNLQTAFSPVNHFGILLNYHYFSATYSYTSSNFFTGVSNTDEGEVKRNFVEMGMGYYIKFQEKFVFEVYGGMGWGNSNFENHGDTYYNINHIRGKLTDNRYFLQPAIGWILSEHFELAFSNRFCLLNYKDLILRGGSEINVYELLRVDDNPLFLIEPAVTLRVGGKNIKFQYQFCFSNYIGNFNGYYDPLAMSFALFFRVNSKDKK